MAYEMDDTEAWADELLHMHILQSMMILTPGAISIKHTDPVAYTVHE